MRLFSITTYICNILEKLYFYACYITVLLESMSSSILVYHSFIHVISLTIAVVCFHYLFFLYIAVATSQKKIEGSVKICIQDSGKVMDASNINVPPLQPGVVSLSAEKARTKAPRQNKTGTSGSRHGVHCVVCNKLFNNSSALAKHKLTHSDERKYVCKICSKAFKRQDHL